MMQQVPKNLQSIPDPGDTFSLRWDPLPGVQQWHVIRCDYPLSEANGAGLLSGGLDLMVTRWELHPTASSTTDDTGVRGKHYVVLGIDDAGQVHLPENFEIATSQTGSPLSEMPALTGWLKGISKKDRYSGVF